MQNAGAELELGAVYYQSFPLPFPAMDPLEDTSLLISTSA